MNETSLTDAKEYFEQIVIGNVDDFLRNPSTFRLAFNAASSLFHQHEWLFECKQSEIESKLGATFSKKGDFWQHVETLVPEAKYIRDLANASKHVKLTIRPSTSMTHIANTVIQSTGYGMGGYGMGRYGGTNIKMKDDGGETSLDDCVQKLHSFWQELVSDMYPYRGPIVTQVPF